MNNYKEKLRKLCGAIKNAGTGVVEDLEFVENRLDKIPNYFNSVITFNVRMPILMAMYEGEEFRDKMSKLDSNRRYAHIAMCDAINQINRLCRAYEVDVIFDTDSRDLISASVDDRAIAAGIAFSFCTELYAETAGHYSSADEMLFHEKHYLKEKTLESLLTA